MDMDDRAYSLFHEFHESDTDNNTIDALWNSSQEQLRVGYAIRARTDQL